jgi:protein SCO1/2
MNARRLVLLFAGISVALALGLVAGRWLLPEQQQGSGMVQIGGPFSLVDHNGRQVTQADYAGRYLLIYFGYTYCPDVCPTELQTMTEALDLLGDDAKAVQPLFITIDPARDTVPAMADYVSHFYDSFVGLTGSAAQVAAAAKAYRVYYAKGPEEEDGVYLMDHSSFIYLMGPDGGYLAHFGPQTSPQAMADKIRSFL